jgi:hypothetical protein
MMTNDFDLNAVDVAKPCTEDWSRMRGDERAKHCAKCEKTVYNLSEMTEDEAKALILGRRGDMCVTFYRRADGTLATAQCPTGLFGVQRRRMKRVAAAAAIVAGALFTGNAFAGPGQDTTMKTDETHDAVTALREQQTKETVCEVAPNESVVYTVLKDDTVATIAAQWKSTEAWIKTANPDVDLQDLKAGQKLRVPYVGLSDTGTGPMVMGLMIKPPPPQVQPTPQPESATKGEE